MKKALIIIAILLFAWAMVSCSKENNSQNGGNNGLENGGNDTPTQVDTYTIHVSATPSEAGTVTGGGAFKQGQYCTVIATANSGYTFTNWTENGSVVFENANYTFAVSRNCTLVANFTFIGAGTYVDLDLPSGLLWANCNVGANAPEEYGEYFAWGEIYPKNIYNESTYQFGNYSQGNHSCLTKYCTNSEYGYNGFTDNLSILQECDDAATSNWGIDWRMPTKDEWQELLDNTTFRWTTRNGVNGLLITALNGNSLFLPTAGFHGGGILYHAGRYGDYWSSSLDTNYPLEAMEFHFGSTNNGASIGCSASSTTIRDCGLSVRAVRVR